MTHLTDLFDKIKKKNKKYFMKLDLSNGFLQIPLDPQDRHKIVFIIFRGKYQFKGMSFGLKNAPFYFQRAMTKVLKPLSRKDVMVYPNDILIYNKNLEKYVDLLKKVVAFQVKHRKILTF